MRIQSLEKVQELNADEIRRSMMSTFFTLRAGLVVLTFLLPVGLLVYSFVKDGYLAAGSISAFYGHNDAAMRDFFVAIVSVVGALLILYKGFSPLEDWLLNFAGAFAIATAFIPCSCWDPTVTKNSWHSFVAVMFFVCMGAVCLFCANDTLNMLPLKDRKRYSNAYYVIGIWLFVAPIGAYAFAFFAGGQNRATFVVEFAAVTVFGIYWLIKSREIRITAAERKALYGALANVDGKVVEQPPDYEQLRRLSVGPNPPQPHRESR